IRECVSFSPRRGRPATRTSARRAQKKRPGSSTSGATVLERVMGFEPTTPTLARSYSTTELHPHEPRGVLVRRLIGKSAAGDKRKMQAPSTFVRGLLLARDRGEKTREVLHRGQQRRDEREQQEPLPHHLEAEGDRLHHEEVDGVGVVHQHGDDAGELQRRLPLPSL